MDETACFYVGSRGLAKICDKKNRVLQSSTRHIDEDILNDLKDGDVIHICSWLALSVFMTTFAPKIDKKVIILTNDSDFDGPVCQKPLTGNVYAEINKEAILSFLNSDYCIHWFTQNCTLDHPKVTPIPIGMDYHTFTFQAPPVMQEQMLLQIKGMSKPFYERILKCYGNYHFTMENKLYSSDRYECFNFADKSLIFYEPQMIQREGTWFRQTQFAFVLSPAGGGYDCHRTWEALNLGCIPIVKRFHQPFEKIYDDLPVLIVDQWSDITEELLQKTIEEFKHRTFNYDKLTLSYWKKLIHSYK